MLILSVFYYLPYLSRLSLIATTLLTRACLCSKIILQTKLKIIWVVVRGTAFAALTFHVAITIAQICSFKTGAS